MAYVKMTDFSRLLATSILLLLCAVVKASLRDQLVHYETLHLSEIKHGVRKRSVDSLGTRTIELTVLSRHFKLQLRRQRNLFAEQFHAYTVGWNQIKVPVAIDKDVFYEGFVADEPDTSDVRAHWEGDNLSATIRTKDDTFVIEPSWRHLAESDEFSMIAYKLSDMRFSERKSNISFCGFVHAGHDDAAYNTGTKLNDDSLHAKTRYRRAAPSRFKNTCPLLLVADFRFYQNIALGSPSIVANYLIGVVSRVDAIYRGTNFGGGFTDYGFEIKEIRMHDESTPRSGHYNVARDKWVAGDLLAAFGQDATLPTYCMAHMFTYADFEGVLGLAYVASPKANSLGGMCSPVGGDGSRYNTGWTTLMAVGGSPLLTQAADLVTAHEFGHNWGAQHDPSATTAKNCDPSSSEGGKYIMYTFANGGYDDNNYKFSPCSKIAMTSVLSRRSGDCFTERSAAYCGNLNVEEGEQCDAGAAGRAGDDACCDRTCQLRAGATCSDTNSICCLRCGHASNYTLCRQPPGGNVSCDAAANCTGSSDVCPPSDSLPDGVGCLEGGTCTAGLCRSVCVTIGKEACACDTVSDACRLCCRDTTTRECRPYTQQPADLPDGRQCVQGFCKAGKCKKSIRKLADRLWHVIRHLNINAIKLFMKENLVLATIIISLLIYIPITIIVACLDCRSDRDDEAEVSWRQKDNEYVIAPGEKVHVQKAYVRRRPLEPTLGRQRGHEVEPL